VVVVGGGGAVVAVSPLDVEVFPELPTVAEVAEAAVGVFLPLPDKPAMSMSARRAAAVIRNQGRFPSGFFFMACGSCVVGEEPGGTWAAGGVVIIPGGGGKGRGGADSGGYHLLSDASHQPGPPDTSLMFPALSPTVVSRPREFVEPRASEPIGSDLILAGRMSTEIGPFDPFSSESPPWKVFSHKGQDACHRQHDDANYQEHDSEIRLAGAAMSQPSRRPSDAVYGLVETSLPSRMHRQQSQWLQ
jgi:hypothetical protein